MTMFQRNSTVFNLKRLITNLLFIAVLLPSSQALAAQLFASKGEVTQQDILRGSITPERSWWDLTHYHLDIKVDPENKSISGTNTMKYVVSSQQKALQVELQQPLTLDKVTQNGETLTFTQQGYSYFINALPNAEIGKEYAVVMHFSGIPK